MITIKPKSSQGQNAKKTYMDAVKIISRNIIYMMLPIFRTLYNNRRNDIKLMLEIIRADGIIEETKDRIIIWLIISREYSPKQKKTITALLFIISCKVNQIYETDKPVVFQIHDL